MSNEPKNERVVELSQDKKLRAAALAESGLTATRIATDLGVNERQVRRILPKGQRTHGSVKRDPAIFRTRASHIECSVMIGEYRNILAMPREPEIWSEVDLDSLISVHTYYRAVFPDFFWKTLDINSAHSLVQRWLDGTVTLRRCSTRHCRMMYCVPDDRSLADECPLCSDPGGHGVSSRVAGSRVHERSLSIGDDDEEDVDSDGIVDLYDDGSDMGDEMT